MFPVELPVYDCVHCMWNDTLRMLGYHGPDEAHECEKPLPMLMAPHIIGVQPMTRNTGQVFTIRRVYGNR